MTTAHCDLRIQLQHLANEELIIQCSISTTPRFNRRKKYITLTIIYLSQKLVHTYIKTFLSFGNNYLFLSLKKYLINIGVIINFVDVKHKSLFSHVQEIFDVSSLHLNTKLISVDRRSTYAHFQVFLPCFVSYDMHFLFVVVSPPHYLSRMNTLKFLSSPTERNSENSSQVIEEFYWTMFLLYNFKLMYICTYFQTDSSMRFTHDIERS